MTEKREMQRYQIALNQKAKSSIPNKAFFLFMESLRGNSIFPTEGKNGREKKKGLNRRKAGKKPPGR